MRHCNQCEVLFINGVKCHELGCPDAWKDEVRECKWCGGKFKPKERHQQLCSNDCPIAYYG